MWTGLCMKSRQNNIIEKYIAQWKPEKTEQLQEK